MRDMLAEVFASMRNNKMRIALTGFSIGWGLFILIVLLGAGNGLLEGMTANFSSSGENIVTLTPGKTSLSWEGMGKGRPVYLTTSDSELLFEGMDDCVKRVFPMLTLQTNVAYGNNNTNLTLEGHVPGWGVVRQMKIVDGRDINDTDITERRKVCVITESLKKILFPDDVIPDECYVDIKGISYLVVGVCRIKDKDGFLYIKGRKKNMILGPSGQNIYPEEIEDKLYNLLFVAECLIVDRDGTLTALVYPDKDEAYSWGLTDGDIANIMDLNIKDLNRSLPQYEQIKELEIMEKPFEKTPKHSIKRYLYM